MRAASHCKHCKAPVSSRKTLCLDCEQIVEREKARAIGIVKRAISAGRLLRAASCKCACCGEQATGYGHHDYARPLDVFPVCRSCNRIRKKPAQIETKVTEYIAPPKREKEQPSGVIALTKIRKAWCSKCEKGVAVNGRFCLECGNLCAKKVATPDFRKKLDALVKIHRAKKANSAARYEEFKRKAEESRKKFGGVS